MAWALESNTAVEDIEGADDEVVALKYQMEQERL
jgi:hypothetical protein